MSSMRHVRPTYLISVHMSVMTSDVTWHETHHSIFISISILIMDTDRGDDLSGVVTPSQNSCSREHFKEFVLDDSVTHILNS